MEWAFTGVFTVELVFRVVCDGFLFTQRAYLKDNWNRVDVTVLLFAWFDLMQVRADWLAALSSHTFLHCVCGQFLFVTGDWYRCSKAPTFQRC